MARSTIATLYTRCKTIILRSVFFFFLMIRRPPRSTPFPTRRSSDLELPLDGGRHWIDGAERAEVLLIPRPDRGARSEEHTSELQSHHDLVCRLLLDKKTRCAKQWRPSMTCTTPSLTN